jgi:hypothetical protein
MNAPEEADGKIVVCPACAKKFQVRIFDQLDEVKQDGGRGESGRGETPLPPRRREAEDGEDKRATGRRRHEDREDDERPRRKGGGIPGWAWIAGGAALCLLVLGGLFVIVVVAVFWRVGPEKKEQANVEASQGVASDLSFGPWTVTHGTDRLGNEGTWFVTTAKAIRHAHSADYRVTLYDSAGVKKESNGILLMPDLSPGETGEVQIRADGAARAVITKGR